MPALDLLDEIGLSLLNLVAIVRKFPQLFRLPDKGRLDFEIMSCEDSRRHTDNAHVN